MIPINLQTIITALNAFPSSYVDIEWREGPALFKLEGMHYTKLGVSKEVFINCSGKKEERENFFVETWKGPDFEYHQVKAQKLASVFQRCKEETGASDELEVLFHVPIPSGKRVLRLDGVNLSEDSSVLSMYLVPQETYCDQPEKCVVPQEDVQVDSCCGTEGGCC